MSERLVIIGGVAAGAKAAAKARRMRPDMDIVLYQDEAEVSYSACGQPYVLSGIIESRDNIVIRRPQEFAVDNIRVLTRHFDSLIREAVVQPHECGDYIGALIDRVE